MEHAACEGRTKKTLRRGARMKEFMKVKGGSFVFFTIIVVTQIAFTAGKLSPREFVISICGCILFQIGRLFR